MTDAALFSIINVSVGFIVSWLLGHYLLPVMFGVPRHAGRATAITAVYTVAALVRNFIVYGVWVGG